MHISQDMRRAKRHRTMRNQKIRWFLGDLIGAIALFGTCYLLIIFMWAIH